VDSYQKLETAVVEGVMVRTLGDKAVGKSVWLFAGVDGYVAKESMDGPEKRRRVVGALPKRTTAPPPYSVGEDGEDCDGPSEKDMESDPEPDDDRPAQQDAQGRLGTRTPKTPARGQPPAPDPQEDEAVVLRKRGASTPSAKRARAALVEADPVTRMLDRIQRLRAPPPSARTPGKSPAATPRGCLPLIIFTAHDCPSRTMQVIKTSPCVEVVHVPKIVDRADGTKQLVQLLKMVRDSKVDHEENGTAAASSAHYKRVTDSDLGVLAAVSDGDIRQAFIGLESAATGTTVSRDAADGVVDVFKAARLLLQGSRALGVYVPPGLAPTPRVTRPDGLARGGGNGGGGGGMYDLVKSCKTMGTKLPTMPMEDRSDVERVYRLATQQPNTLQFVRANMFGDPAGKDPRVVEAMARLTDVWSQSIDTYEKIVWRRGTLDSLPEKACVFHAMETLALLAKPGRGRDPVPGPSTKLEFVPQFRGWEARAQFLVRRRDLQAGSESAVGVSPYVPTLVCMSPLEYNEYMSTIRVYREAVRTLRTPLVQTSQADAEAQLQRQGLDPARWADAFYCRFGVSTRLAGEYADAAKSGFAAVGLQEF
jgi:hypothetical protein